VQASTPTTESAVATFGRPQITFFCELDGPALHELLRDGQVLTTLAASGYGVAVSTRALDAATAEVVRLLNSRGILAIAWLLLAPSEGSWLNLRNYPQAVERYHAFRAWSQSHALHFQAIGLDIEPPEAAIANLQRWGARHIANRVWQARENVLFAAARAAYTDLITEIHHDGYEVHTYQLPILADDRRAGSSLSQRTLDIIDLPADVEVLSCYSSAPIARLDNDLGGALILSYGPAADAISIGAISGIGARDGGDDLPQLPWDALERDLLLAAHHTDMIYVYSLEGCVERGLLTRITQINWDAEPTVLLWKRAIVASARGALLVGLLLARFSRALLAWLGWGLFALLLARQLRGAVQRR